MKCIRKRKFPERKIREDLYYILYFFYFEINKWEKSLNTAYITKYFPTPS